MSGAAGSADRYVQVKSLKTVDALRAHLEALGVAIPVDDEVAADGPLAESFTIVDGSAGDLVVPNRFAILPMEGWDGTTDGRPTDLVRRRWGRFAASGAGLVWGEATAVRPDGRANPNQLVLDASTVDDLAALRSLLDPAQVVGLQLTHSGRWSRPDADGPRPRTACPHPILDARQGIDGSAAFADDELDALAATYVDAAVLAGQAGFDFVDVKHCHGYLLHELLTAYERPGEFGGTFEGRTRFFRNVVERIRAEVPDLMVALRLSVFDFVPFVPGHDRVGQPAAEGSAAHTFGGDGSGTGVDLTETHALLDLATELGVGLVSATAGSPYYNPHIQRPAYFPPSDGYLPPEDPLVGVTRLLDATRELQRRHSELAIVTGAMSYLQDWIAHVGQAVIADGSATSIGLGRMALSYPDLPADVLAGKDLDRHLVCRTLSDCTTAPRNGLISGCYPLDDFYKERPERTQLTLIKRSLRQTPRSLRQTPRSLREGR